MGYYGVHLPRGGKRSQSNIISLNIVREYSVIRLARARKLIAE